MHVICKKLYRNGIKLKKNRLDSDTIEGELSTYSMGGGPNVSQAVPMAQIKEHAGAVQELATLYKVVVSFVSADALQLTGLERMQTEKGVCWVAQVWRCQIIERTGA